VKEAMAGRIYLMGAGPGDPELLTAKAHRVLSTCDAVFHDASVPEAILEIAPASAKRISMEKLNHPETADSIGEMAENSGVIAVLKAGDAFSFGDLSAEALALSERGLGFHIVPGISIPAGLGAAAGLPLTHRGDARGVRFLRLDEDFSGLDWHGMADPECSLAVYGALADFGSFAQNLLDAGMSKNMPVAQFQGETRAKRTTLWIAAEKGLDKSTSLVIIGKVANVAETLESWIPREES